jgi:hypothetical protein
MGTNFHASKLAFSPKKSVTKKKRLYVNMKRIPRWAADPVELMNVSNEQRKDPKFDPESIYGVCVIERLDTNIVFNSNDFYIRGSSAKWNKHPYCTK